MTTPNQQPEVSAEAREAALKRCPKCGEIKASTEFYNTKYPSYCKPCRKAYDAGRVRRGVYNPSHNWTEAARIKKRKWARLNPNPAKQNARRAVRSAIEAGLITPKLNCERCGNHKTRIDGRRAIQAHHFEGYDKPLSVQWLCPKCHKDEHNNVIKGALL